MRRERRIATLLRRLASLMTRLTARRRSRFDVVSIPIQVPQAYPDGFFKIKSRNDEFPRNGRSDSTVIGPGDTLISKRDVDE